MNKKNHIGKLLLLTSFVLSETVWLNAQTNQLPPKAGKSDQEQLLSLEYAWLSAEFSLDTAFVSSLMDTGFIAISAEKIANKNEELQAIYRNISLRIKDSVFVDSFHLENPVVKIYGNTAVVTFIVHTCRKDKGISAQYKTRFYDVWIKRNGHWKAVSSQGTKLPNF